jgi:CBS domain-containing protein
MDDEILDEEFSIMYVEPERINVLDSTTFLKPIKNLKVPRPVTVSADTPLRHAVELLQQKSTTCLLVVGETGRLIGILTERDLVLKAMNVDLASVTVSGIMTPDPESFQPDDSIGFVMNAMDVGGFRHVPVVDENGSPIAVVSVSDILEFIVQTFPEEVLNLPPKPMRTTEEREGA